MEHLWIPITLITALIQTGRNGLMKDLKSKMNDETIMFARFLFATPFAGLWLWCFHALGYELPQLSSASVRYGLLAIVCQMTASLLFLKLFGRRNFVIGVTYCQTQVIMNVIFSALLFAQFVSLGALIAIILSFLGIVMITMGEQHLEPKNLVQRLFTPSAMIGLGCGVFFGMSGVFFREALLSMESGEFFIRAAYLSFLGMGLEAMIIGLIIWFRTPEQIGIMFRNRPKVYIVGIINSVSSLGWLIAFSLTHSAYVYMLGQIEVVFSVLLAQNLFKERTRQLEWLGIMIVIGSIILLVCLQ